jgi:hypothetical protein
MAFSGPSAYGSFRPIAVITASVAAMMLVMATWVENDVVEAAF